jgi:hypothetical protein
MAVSSLNLPAFGTGSAELWGGWFPCRSEVLRDTGLLQHCVRGVPGQDFLV